MCRCEYESIYRLECMVCGYVGEWGKKEIVVVSDSVKSVCVCKRCFIKTLQDFSKEKSEFVRSEWRIFKDEVNDGITFERFVRFYYIDYILERKHKPHINLYI